MCLVVIINDSQISALNVLDSVKICSYNVVFECKSMDLGVEVQVHIKLDCEPQEVAVLPLVKLGFTDVSSKPKPISYVECHDSEIAKKLPKDYEHLHEPPIMQ